MNYTSYFLRSLPFPLRPPLIILYLFMPSPLQESLYITYHMRSLPFPPRHPVLTGDDGHVARGIDPGGGLQRHPDERAFRLVPRLRRPARGHVCAVHEENAVPQVRPTAHA